MIRRAVGELESLFIRGVEQTLRGPELARLVDWIEDEEGKKGTADYVLLAPKLISRGIGGLYNHSG